jgi:Tricorn protease C1 domain
MARGLCAPAVLLLRFSSGGPAWPANSDSTAEQKADLASFEQVWNTLRDRYWDQNMGGLNWQAVHDRFLSQVKAAQTRETVINNEVVVESVAAGSGAAKAGVGMGWIVKAVDNRPTRELFALFESESTLNKAALIEQVTGEWLEGRVGSMATVRFLVPRRKEFVRVIERGAATGEVVRFGNLPPERVVFEYRKLESQVGYMR